MEACLVERVCDDALFVDCFFLICIFGRFDCLLRVAFFACFAVALFDFVRVLLLFFFLEGMPAVYHQD